eukprot:TRINITY_DN6672_c1_g1_i1.p2 TRINITY_DN6672_c1_g1~~TRINITY_DN6672_c1_g1_i1.p2  ORF type:complete len:189 (+),score=-32.50 TRINITY_DN6672_c1_g1_i1:537-1103(+)
MYLFTSLKYVRGIFKILVNMSECSSPSIKQPHRSFSQICSTHQILKIVKFKINQADKLSIYPNYQNILLSQFVQNFFDKIYNFKLSQIKEGNYIIIKRNTHSNQQYNICPKYAYNFIKIICMYVCSIEICILLCICFIRIQQIRYYISQIYWEIGTIQAMIFQVQQYNNNININKIKRKKIFRSLNLI